ncbi:unnamed protein product [Sphenostylis stenocarpa]|uniref:Zinc finger C5HC2-type domain-containing protein n=1 Tax=Sphenostylis stenocarpa TaxID=92480 RepID=A0AA86VIA4_9FABA|nr:unnamed protein product [Sphenostylis stenocarpa]
MQKKDNIDMNNVGSNLEHYTQGVGEKDSADEKHFVPVHPNESSLVSSPVMKSKLSMGSEPKKNANKLILKVYKTLGSAISHIKLFCAHETINNLTLYYQSRIQSKILKRKFLSSSLVSKRMDENFYATCRRECSICLYYLHLSAVGCSCSNDKFTCLGHAKHFCSCPWSNKILLYRYKINDLNVLCQALDGKLSAVYKWAKEYLGLTLTSVASKRSKPHPENVSCSTFPLQDLHMKEPYIPDIIK